MAPTVIPIVFAVPQQSVNIIDSQMDLTNGNMFLNNGYSIVMVRNTVTGSVPIVITVTAVPDEAGRTGTAITPASNPPGYAVTVPSFGKCVLGPFRQAWWNQTTINIGYVYITAAYVPPNASGPAPYISIINP